MFFNLLSFFMHLFMRRTLIIFNVLFARQGIVFPVLLYDNAVYCWLVCPGPSFQQVQPLKAVSEPGPWTWSCWIVRTFSLNPLCPVQQRFGVKHQLGPGGYFYLVPTWLLVPHNILGKTKPGIVTFWRCCHYVQFIAFCILCGYCSFFALRPR